MVAGIFFTITAKNKMIKLAKKGRQNILPSKGLMFQMILGCWCEASRDKNSKWKCQLRVKSKMSWQVGGSREQIFTHVTMLVSTQKWNAWKVNQEGLIRQSKDVSWHHVK